MPTYVEYGVADCGIAGRDVLLETGADVLEPLDLGFGRCRPVVASPPGSGFAPDRASTTRVASKYPRVTAAHFLGGGSPSRSCGSPDRSRSPLASASPTASWTWSRAACTFAENGLEVVDTVAESSARLIVNRASFHARRDEVQGLVETLRRASR